MVLFLLAAVAWVSAPPADAHATITSTSPNNGQVFDAGGKPPDAVTVTFDEPVTLTDVRVIDGTGEKVDTGGAGLDRAATTLTVPLPADLPHGAYIASWSLVSADSHPVGGSIQFGYGAPVGTVADAEDPEPDPALTVLAGVVKASVYVGVALTFGVAPVLLMLGAGAVRRITRTGAVLVVVTSVLQLVVQHLWISSVQDGGSWQGLFDLVRSEYGAAVALRSAAAVAAVAATHLRRRSSRSPAPASAAVACGSVVATGHGGAGPGWQFVSTLLHVAGAVGWLSGLGVLSWLVGTGRLTAAVITRMPRWSLYAAVCVTVVLVSGALQALRQVRFAGALLTTDYGLILVVKLVLVAVVLGLGLRSFLSVRRYRGDNGKPVAHRRPLRGVHTEAVLAAVVLVVSGVLSSVTPATTDYAPTSTTRTETGPYDVTVDAGPLRPGPVSFRVTAVRPDAGRNEPLPQAVRLTLSRADGTPGELPVEVPVRLPGKITEGESTPVTFVSSSVNVPAAGGWLARVELTADTYERYVVEVPVTVS